MRPFQRSSQDAGVPSTVGQQTRRFLRWALWSATAVALTVVLVNGVIRIVGSPAQVVPSARAGSDVGFDAARAYAASFARTLLSWSPATAEAQENELASMFADDVDAAQAVRPAKSQRVIAAWPGPALVRHQAARIVVTCLIARDGTTVTQNIAVPVAWTLRNGTVNGLVVYDYPALKSPAPKAASPPGGGQALDSVEGEAIASLLTRFFGAYLAGGDVAPEFLTTSAIIQPLARSYTLVGDLDSDDVEQIGPGANDRQIAATVRARDNATRAVFTFRHRVWVRRDIATGRWLVDAI